MIPSIDWRGIAYYLSSVLYFFGYAHVVPLLASIILGENPDFSILIIVDMFLLFGLAWLLKRVSVPSEISIGEALIVMALTFIIPGFTGALPILAYGVSFIDALFEGVSAITTTGLSVLPGYALTSGVHFLRSFYQWLGGIGIALMIVSFMVSPGTAAFNLYAAHLGRFRIKPLSRETIKIILEIYVALTIIFMVSYWAGGMTLYDAIINSLTTVSTGGFSRFSIFTSIPMFLAIIFMYLSAQPLAMYFFFLKKKPRSMIIDIQLIQFTLFMIICTLIFYFLTNAPVQQSLFQVVSALSTTGYTSLDNSLLPDSAKYLLSILMIIGAGFGSTGGGLKQLRIYILLRSLIHSINKQLLPRKAVLPLKIRNETVAPEEINWVYILFSLYVIVLVVSVLLFVSYGYPLSDSLFESSSALATTGLSVGLSSSSLNPILKLVLIIDMWFGRVEIAPFFLLFLAIIHSLGGKK